MNEQTKQDILTWAQEQVNAWDSHYEDWWDSYNNEWDINIWDDTALGDGSNTAIDSTGICVTAYRIYTDQDGDLQTDQSNYVRLGYCQQPDSWPDIDR